MSAIINYKVSEVKPLHPTGSETVALPQRLLGRLLTAQDVVNLGGQFEGNNRVIVLYQGQQWLLTLEQGEASDEWNALPHGRDEGAYDTDVQVDRRVQRLYIP